MRIGSVALLAALVGASSFAQGQAPYTGRPDAAVGLWETVLVARPRVSHPKQNPPKSMAELEAMGQMGYLFGLPMKTLKCGSSPLKEYLSRPPVSAQCRRQIDARGGTCEFEGARISGGTGILSNKEAVTLTGNYWDHLTAKVRFIRVYAEAPSDPVVDESETTIRFLGACKSDMKPGDEYRVAEDGRLVPARD